MSERVAVPAKAGEGDAFAVVVAGSSFFASIAATSDDFSVFSFSSYSSALQASLGLFATTRPE